MGKYLDKARQLSQFCSKHNAPLNTRENIEIEREESNSTDLTKETNLTKEGPRDLHDSAKRLEARGVCVAVWDTGDMAVVLSEADTVKAIEKGAAIYSPADLLHFTVTLSSQERRLFHGFKKVFGGTTEWRKK